LPRSVRESCQIHMPSPRNASGSVPGAVAAGGPGARRGAGGATIRIFTMFDRGVRSVRRT
jgi:hypothetical protein